MRMLNESIIWKRGTRSPVALVRLFAAGLLVAGLGLMTGCASVSGESEWKNASPAMMEPSPALEACEKEAALPGKRLRLEEQWGVEVSSVRLTAAGYMLDFRYTILDPEKATFLVTRKNKPILIDQASGAEVIVPTPPKVGSLRSNSRNGTPVEGRAYFILFANPGGFIKPGNKVTVVIGDFRAEDLIVE